MGNFIIDTRIKKLERIKQGLLSLKKNQRGDELDQVNQMIARLKRWNMELEKEKFLKIPRKTFPNVGNYQSAITENEHKNEKGFLSCCKNKNECHCKNGINSIASSVLGLIPQKDSQRDENIDTFCAMMRMSNE